MKKLKHGLRVASVASFIGLVAGVESAFAGGTNNSGNEASFNTIVGNMSDSISELPGLISGLSYMVGILLGVLGILKIKDHVENPTNAKLQDGAVRLAAGGALFALPIVYEAMRTTIGDQGASVAPPAVKALELKTTQ